MQSRVFSSPRISRVKRKLAQRSDTLGTEAKRGSSGARSRDLIGPLSTSCEEAALWPTPRSLNGLDSEYTDYPLGNVLQIGIIGPPSNVPHTTGGGKVLQGAVEFSGYEPLAHHFIPYVVE